MILSRCSPEAVVRLLAVVVLRKSDRLNPAAWGPRLTIVDILRTTGRIDEAEKMLAPIAAGNPDHPDILLARARMLQGREKHEEALPLYDRLASGHAARWPRTPLDAIDCLLKLLRPREAIRRLDALLASDARVPDDVRADAKRIKREVEGIVGPVGTAPFGPEAPFTHRQAFEAALVRNAGVEPSLKWLVEEPRRRPPGEPGSFLEYHVAGVLLKDPQRTHAEVRFWASRDGRALPQPSGARLAQQIEGAPAWVPSLKSELASAFPGVIFAVGWRGVHGTSSRTDSRDARADVPAAARTTMSAVGPEL